MSDKDQNDIPKEQDAADDGDIDNLSQTEKAAFEKIMAQIGEAEDETPANAADPDEPESSEVADAPPDLPQSDDQDPPDNANAEDTNDSDDQASGDDLDDDQRAALDKIMAEIGGEDEEEPNATVDQSSTEGKDQQANLEKIMAEIESDGTDTDSPTDGESLSDDQQAALDQIMSEIKGDDETSDDAASDASPPDSDTADEAQPSDPEHEQPTDTDQAPPAPPDDKSQVEKETDGLSMEEFDDELSSLLTDTGRDTTKDNKAAKTGSPKKQDPAPTDHSLEDINSALKNIVKKSDAGESDSETEGSQKQIASPDPSTVLEEITPAPTPKKPNSSSASPLKKYLISACIACTVILIATATYWGYIHKFKPDAEQHDIAAASQNSVPDTQSTMDVTSGDVLTPSETTVSSTIPIASSPAANMPNAFEEIRKEIDSTRAYIQIKKEEILELKSYYQNGILDERNKLLAYGPSKPLSFKAAIENRQIELGLRSIQRRTAYNTKLDQPLAQIEAYLEQLLYFERRIRLFELLESAISGLSLSDLKRQGSDIINKLRKEIDQLSVEQVNADPPSLKSIWQGLTDHQGSASASSNAATRSNPQDQRISKAICKGSFERKYLLTSLTSQTAQCLAKWPGMDLYLNGLTHLTPETAKALTQWQGEWLSLNGIKTLSPESARYLSLWPGKRLSLNGVVRLSAEATTYLAQWQGEQLEMVGLTSIGRWENYVTHLFLSESLRRKLQVQ